MLPADRVSMSPSATIALPRIRPAPSSVPPDQDDRALPNPPTRKNSLRTHRSSRSSNGQTAPHDQPRDTGPTAGAHANDIPHSNEAHDRFSATSFGDLFKQAPQSARSKSMDLDSVTTAYSLSTSTRHSSGLPNVLRDRDDTHRSPVVQPIQNEASPSTVPEEDDVQSRHATDTDVEGSTSPVGSQRINHHIESIPISPMMNPTSSYVCST